MFPLKDHSFMTVQLQKERNRFQGIKKAHKVEVQSKETVIQDSFN